MPVTTGDSGLIAVGAGILYAAPIGTAEPASPAAVTAASAWREIGWTDKGSVIEHNVTITPIEVEEEFYPVLYSVTKIESYVGFAMKMADRRNLALALNAGAAAVNDNSTLEPPAPGSEVRVMLAHVSDNGALWLFRQCINGDNIQINRQKAPNVALLPVKFSCEKPSSAQPWKLTPATGGKL